jgi:membrane-bound metal-dependent hydrolase YbcI (DUF457 family)
VLAGTIADLDLLSTFVGPATYLSSRQTFTHSIWGTVAVIAVAVGIALLLGRKTLPYQQGDATKNLGIPALVGAASLVAILHVLMDVWASVGVALLWPWRATRFAWDWLPWVDPWILALLLAGILLPELFQLIGSEIGTKNTAPHGRNGAIAALALVLIYIGVRAALHGNAIAQLDAHTYRGESPRRLAAFADPASLITWRGIVETSTQICALSVPATLGARFDPESGPCVHKPQDSPALALAVQTESVKKFLQSARFPKASVGATDDGMEVAIRDVRDKAENETRFALAVRVLLNSKGQVKSQEILWANKVSLK